MTVIGLTGRAQHGKDTIGQHLVGKYGFVRVSFADKLKELALRVDPILFIPDSESQEEWLAASGRGWDDEVRLSWLVSEYGWDEAKLFPEVRRFLQALGNEAREVLGPDVWVEAVRGEASRAVVDGQDLVFTDVRYPNEADFIRELSGQLWLVRRPNFDNGVDPNHPSERQVEELGAPYVVYNRGTLDDLRKSVDWMLPEAYVG